MRISIPQKDGYHKDSIVYFGALRDLRKLKEDQWKLKISVPEITRYDNLWITLSDEEIDFLEQEIRRHRSSNKTGGVDKTRGKVNG